jgi:DNA-binding winged helix-turn-helix (wHTH) protein
MLRRTRNPAIVPDADERSMQYNAQDAAQPGGWRCGEFLIEPARRRLTRAGAPVDVEERTFDLIALLAAHHDRALDRREITSTLWGSRPVSDTTLRQVVYKARQALGDDGRRQAVIRTLHGRSLQWVASIEPVTVGKGAAPSPPRSLRSPIARRTAAWALAALLVVAVAGLGLRALTRVPPTEAPLRVAILPIENATGNGELDWARNGVPGLLASQLGGSRLDVVDPRAVAEAAGFKNVAGWKREQQLRAATGAGALVSGRLTRIGSLYELDLDLDHPPARAQTLRVTGEQPAALAIEAAPRLRHALGADAAPRTPGQAPAEPFAAEAYARGMDAVARGRMDEARAFFEACVRAAPDFTPGRFGLGVARIASHDLDAGEETLRGVLDAAQARDDAALRLRTLDELAYAAIMRDRFADARELLARGDGAVARTTDPDIAVTHALRTADVESRLGHADAAESALERARALIATHGLRRREADLRNGEAMLAQARGDAAAAERSLRAALAASEAIGNERDAAGDAYNLALSLLGSKRRDDALVLLATAYADAGASDAWLSFGAGDNLAIALLDSGLDRRAAALAARIATIAEQQDNRGWQVLAHLLDGAIALYRGDAVQAKSAFALAAQRVDARQDARLAAGALLYLATATCSVAPGEVDAIERRIGGIVAAHADLAALRYPQQLVRALAAAAHDDADGTRAALAAAAALPHADDPDENDLHMVALTIAQRDPSAAAGALEGFDVSGCDDATILRLFARAARARGDDEARLRAERRIQTLRAAAAAALAHAPLVLPPAAAAHETLASR